MRHWNRRGNYKDAVQTRPSPKPKTLRINRKEKHEEKKKT